MRDGGVKHSGSLFAVCAAAFGLADVGAGETGGGEEPTGDAVGREGVGAFVEEDEDGLGGVLGGVGVAQLAEAGGVDEVDVLSDQGAEGVVTAGRGVVFEKGGHGNPCEVSQAMYAEGRSGQRFWKM